jgi:hypothetical protein
MASRDLVSVDNFPSFKTYKNHCRNIGLTMSKKNRKYALRYFAIERKQRQLRKRQNVIAEKILSEKMHSSSIMQLNSDGASSKSSSLCSCNIDSSDDSVVQEGYKHKVISKPWLMLDDDGFTSDTKLEKSIKKLHGRHRHTCDWCDCVYIHFHFYKNVKHNQYKHQCPNPDCEQYHSGKNNKYAQFVHY